MRSPGGRALSQVRLLGAGMGVTLQGTSLRQDWELEVRGRKDYVSLLLSPEANRVVKKMHYF